MSELAANARTFFRQKENRYLLFGLILPAYLIAFSLIEALIPADACKPTYIPLDDKIPFLEGFVVPYMLWFPMILAMAAYLAWRDHEGFKRYMTFLGVSLSTVLVLYVLFPNRQDLRVTQFPRDNLFTWIVSIVYSQDTNTNVCPSIHVVGSLAVGFAALHCKRLCRPVAQVAIWALCILVSVSTVFVKQHSALDVILAVPLSMVAYFVVYRLIFKKAKN